MNEHGVKYDEKKTELGINTFKHHGANWDLSIPNQPNVGITQKMYKWIKKAIKLIVKYKYATVKFWYCLIGRLMYISQLYPPTKALVCHCVWFILNYIKNANLNNDDIIQLALLIIIIDLLYWDKFIDYAIKVPLFYLIKSYNFSFIMSSDASSIGIGFFFNNQYISIPIPSNLLHWHINEKEAYALLVGVNHFKSQIKGLQGKIFVDNQCVVDAFARKWSSNPRIMSCIYLICLILMENKSFIFLQWLSSKMNIFADLLSRNKIKTFKIICNTFNIKFNTQNFQSPQLNFDFSNAEKIFKKKLTHLKHSI